METPEPGSKVKRPDQPGHQDRNARTSRAIKTETPGPAGPSRQKRPGKPGHQDRNARASRAFAANEGGCLLRLELGRKRPGRGDYRLTFELMQSLLQLKVVSGAELDPRRRWRNSLDVRLGRRRRLIVTLYGGRRNDDLGVQRRVAFRAAHGNLEMMLEIGFAQPVRRVAPIIDGNVR